MTMYANRTHANRPTPYTAADRARMTAAVRLHDARDMRKARNVRTWRLIAACGGALVAAMMFYGF